MVGLAPWQDPQKVLGEFHKYDDLKDEMPTALKAEQLDISTPMRIVDYVELPDGTIKIDVH